MSRTYLQHPELFPQMRATDRYYEDHIRDSIIDRKPKCAICNKCDHTTEWHHTQLMKDLQREK